MSAVNRACESISRCCYDCFHTPLTRKNLLIWGGVLLGIVILIIIIAVAASGSHGKATPPGSYVIQNYPLIDGANNLAANMKLLFQNNLQQTDFDINKDMSKFYADKKCQSCQTDFFRLKKGFVGTQVFVAEANCSSQGKDSIPQIIEQIDVIQRLIDWAKIELLTSPAKLKDKYGSNSGAMISVRGGHSIDSRLAVLRSYKKLGVSSISLVSYSNRTNDATPHNITCYPPWIVGTGLTDFGKKVIDEIKRLGMIIDLTGLNKIQIQNIIEYAKCPVIFSHSNSATLMKHDNNLDDDTLAYLKNQKVLVMLTFTPEQISATNHTIAAFIEHLSHIKDTIGISRVGLGSNFDMSVDLISQLEDVSKFPYLFDMLGKTKWSQDDLRKLAGENFIQIFSEVEKIAKNNGSSHPLEVRAPCPNLNTNDTLCYTDRCPPKGTSGEHANENPKVTTINPTSKN